MNSLHFSVKGSKTNPALVFLHGFMGNNSDWGYITSALSDQYYCISVDLPGHGMSQALKPDVRHGFRQVHRLLEHTLKHLGVREYSLVGYSMGGRLAAFHASLKPKGLRAVILESAHLGLNDEAQKNIRLDRDKKWATRLRQESFEQVLQDWYQQPIFANLSELERQHQIEIKRQYDPKPLAAMLEATSLARQIELSEKLAKLQFPIALVVGNEDTKFATLAEELLGKLKQAKRYQIAGAGHNTHVAKPEEFIAIVRQFLGESELPHK
ncbi:2-succinyl-6-hydroxy-2,4-cyclohexadiene-1-carboxylate synthase [Celerinatantimonas diazotrophica]|uniref:Putative 2-succinyl-6-hydroxy-2,4-cyclohexadiene-1-carboxylate synthase n=1 Tax=Celerinatantimonas diazotrophica TaxID=412034 RepID=A0A4R1J8F0_9GAMM|nr:2-succinyl-6-hydroxy-2,4-cyclohexadiene-1-carboxylate synthase [Celerinatantimonas diazotrophica]TCK46637.1 2-succinyl-6-hydroxy-2,4-cyclohexadiene-1-carboxylate synthase [Celerinatantimonas diazotrophica]CAG9295339.1 2-succinyl-6-hydroxy-2, 4-cyclohexadiene-1-carboxylate synthase [Celerinatantimonas diazotrophica]